MATTLTALAMDNLDRFIKTVARIANIVCQDYKSSAGTSGTEVIIHTNVVITVSVRPQGTIIWGEDCATVISGTPQDILDTNDYQSKMKLHDYQILNQTENLQQGTTFSYWQQNTQNQSMPR